ncbi:Aldehyde/histidinol dehydrogenase [Suillus fuscotomentosus]|uniref:Aldehyde/histidinol dehydrogenase n=1 Tax=Suillus fuscotomentosus TaxID=1912939 RepID=A0AAD4E8I6_9AGAM|nr:Aldehyde/histidinol dehydrogenase [Suillus fuscotomentosus]KAG1901688.1 Aldehyde/histidinol dehydrogenase [Suillus fuscotomentosus]
MPWNDRATIFLRAAELLSGKYRYRLAEIDAAAEVSFRFGVKCVEELYTQQPPKNAAGSWNCVEYRALEGFVLAVSPFNFTAISGNLPGVPSIVGNTVVWKPSPAATYSNYLIYQILAEADVPPSVIQCIPGHFQKSSHPQLCCAPPHRQHVYNQEPMERHHRKSGQVKRYPRIVGETEGKNFRVIYKSAEIRNAVLQIIRVSERRCNYIPTMSQHQIQLGCIWRRTILRWRRSRTSHIDYPLIQCSQWLRRRQVPEHHRV